MQGRQGLQLDYSTTRGVSESKACTDLIQVQLRCLNYITSWGSCSSSVTKRGRALPKKVYRRSVAWERADEGMKARESLGRGRQAGGIMAFGSTIITQLALPDPAHLNFVPQSMD